jgi:hypothetical protein
MHAIFLYTNRDEFIDLAVDINEFNTALMVILLVLLGAVGIRSSLHTDVMPKMSHRVTAGPDTGEDRPP